MIDLAVGVIVGSAFSAIVTSLVNDIISPLLGLLFQQDFAELSVSFGGITLAYGAFITAVINFLIVTLALFAVVKAINTASRLFKRKQEETPAEPAVKVCPFAKVKLRSMRPAVRIAPPASIRQTDKTAQHLLIRESLFCKSRTKRIAGQQRFIAYACPPFPALHACKSAAA